ncbi:hypothetical protein SprV_0301370400 [Sparganum proliferum]
MSAEQCFRIAIQTTAVRKRLRKYLSPLDQSNFDLALPKFALNNPIIVYLDDSWVEKKLAIEEVLLRSPDLVTKLELWNEGPVYGKGIKSFLNEFISMPFVNVVSVYFSDQCISTADYFTYFRNQNLPRLRRLSLCLYHMPDVLVTAGIDTENLRKLQTSLQFFSHKKLSEGIQFPSLELVVLHCTEMSAYLKKKWKYDSLFPNAKVHFGFGSGCGNNDPNDCGASSGQSLALTDPNDVSACPSGVRFMGCSELYFNDGRIVPLSLKSVHLEFCLEPIINCHRRRRGGVSLEKSDIEEIMLRADVGISGLRCALTSMKRPRMATVVQNFGTVARLKVLPLWTAQKNTLTSVDISAELLIGCLKDQQALRQIMSLRGQLSNVTPLSISAPSLSLSLPPLSRTPVYSPSRKHQRVNNRLHSVCQYVSRTMRRDHNSNKGSEETTE